MSPVIDILLYMKLDVQRRRSIDAQAAMYNKVVQADVGSLFFVSLDICELDVVSLGHFSTILPLMVFDLCHFGQQFYN